ncbi:hypothetical protein ACFQS3_11825 [Glycomyces mayteni]|uniref:Secreted protein n=1 Tax=Glycomyces mayteni TaxID=543887 RepID=A0ABW2D6A0_9ACTN|nr:hypothetical protein GCM10025732_34260 [Glycomyces mayteni]
MTPTAALLRLIGLIAADAADGELAAPARDRFRSRAGAEAVEEATQTACSWSGRSVRSRTAAAGAAPASRGPWQLALRVHRVFGSP